LGVKIGPTVQPVDEIKEQKNTERNPTVANWLFAQTTHVVMAPYGLACVVTSGK